MNHPTYIAALKNKIEKKNVEKKKKKKKKLEKFKLALTLYATMKNPKIKYF
jgi:hypothetical protein